MTLEKYMLIINNLQMRHYKEERRSNLIDNPCGPYKRAMNIDEVASFLIMTNRRDFIVA